MHQDNLSNFERLLKQMQEINRNTIPRRKLTGRERADDAELGGAAPHYRRLGAPYGDQ